MMIRSAQPSWTAGTFSNVPSLMDTDLCWTFCLNTSRMPALGSNAFKEAILISSSSSANKARVNSPVPAPILVGASLNSDCGRRRGSYSTMLSGPVVPAAFLIKRMLSSGYEGRALRRFESRQRSCRVDRFVITYHTTRLFPRQTRLGRWCGHVRTWRALTTKTWQRHGYPAWYYM